MSLSPPKNVADIAAELDNKMPMTPANLSEETSPHLFPKTAEAIEHLAHRIQGLRRTVAELGDSHGGINAMEDNKNVHERLARQLAVQRQREQAAAARFEDGLAAVRRLVKIAQGDTGQSRRVADFLLAWWNAGSCGSFDLTELWAVDGEIADDMVAVFRLVADRHEYPTAYGLGEDFEQIVAAWRPELLK